MNQTFKEKHNSFEKLHGYEKQVEKVAEELEALYMQMGRTREVKLAVTCLEESVMWAVKSIYKKHK